MGMKHTLFISDLHLQESEPEKTRLFLNFLQNTARRADALYILGDFFEVWVGDDDNNEFIIKIKSALKQFSEFNVPIYFMHGNRDFLIGKKFANETGCRIIQNLTKIEVYGKSILLTHGDILYNEANYLKFRKLVRNPKCQKLFLILPLKLRKMTAKYLREKSANNKYIKLESIKDKINQRSVQLMQQYQTSCLIQGHVHKPAIEELTADNSTFKRITLGAWNKNQGNALFYYQDNNYNLQNIYNPLK